jgi:hypothetical protein
VTPPSPYAQELVFIGTQMDAELLRADQNGCLMQEGVALPASDPFPCLGHLRLLREMRA